MNTSLARFAAAGMLAATAFFGAPVASADTALIVPGTAPSPYGPLRSTYHFKPEMQPLIDANYYSPDAVRRIVPYPGSFWPITGWDSPTVNSSVNTGASNLDSAIRSTQGPITAAGLSQGTLALDREQTRLAHDPTAPPADQLTFIKAGDPNNLLEKMFGPGAHVPIIDYTVPGPQESQYRTINIVGQYDPFSDPPNHPGNLLADANAVVAGGYYGHSATAFSDPAKVAPWDIKRSTNAMGGTTTTYFIRNRELPLARALVDLVGMPPEKVPQMDATLRPLINRAYDPGPAHQPFNGINAVTHLPTAYTAASLPVRATTATIGAVAAANTASKVLPKILPAVAFFLLTGK